MAFATAECLLLAGPLALTSPRTMNAYPGIRQNRQAVGVDRISTLLANAIRTFAHLR